MNLIEVFENKPFQDVGTFNAVFKSTPILGFPSSTEVEIKELVSGGERRVLVGRETLFIDLTQKKAVVEKKRAKAEVRAGLSKLFKKKRRNQLPELYRKLSASEFMILSAVRELGEVDGISELTRNIALNRKTISQALPRLISLGLIKTERAVSSEGDFLKISVDTADKN